MKNNEDEIKYNRVPGTELIINLTCQNLKKNT